MLDIYKKELAQHIINRIEKLPEDVYVADLDFYCFNENHYINDPEQAKEWLKRAGISQILQYVDKYKRLNHEQLNSDLSWPINAATMLAHILGGELFQEVISIRDNWDNNLTPEIKQQIINELQELCDPSL